MKYFFIVIILVNFNSCRAQKKVSMEQEMIIPTINIDFEKFKTNNFDSKNENKIIKEGDLFVKRMSQSYGYAEQIIYENSPFSIAKLFYKNFNIKKKGIMFNNGSEYGTWYEYNENGELIKEINTDEGYEYGWKDILKYCNKNEIKLTAGNPKSGGVHTEIYKTEIENKKVWQITYYNYDTNQLFEVTLNGKTGNQIKKRELEFIGG